ncbi:MAG: peptidase domain-containing ABC transporter, partial [Chloroflexia bacterium]|nr:peptidase domain-containing ABC transporter [Chloroflexia bacterium]
MDGMDCGPACLRMIASYYGKDYDIDTLRKSCYISKGGVSLLGISEAAENIGFKTLGGRFTLKKLKENIPLPCIIHWSQEHFVVLYKIKTFRFINNQTKLYIADPGSGFITYSEEEFKEHWLSTKTNGEDKGVALVLEPTRKFYEQEGEKLNHRSLMFLYSYFLRYKRFFGQLFL